MPEQHDERDERDGFEEDLDDAGLDDEDLDEEDEFYEGYGPRDAGHSWAAAGYPPPGFPPPPGRPGARRGWVFALTAVVAAAAAFGIVDAAVRDVSGSPAASAGPSASASSPSGGEQFAPPGGAPAALPSGAAMQLELGGPVTAVSATSITIGRGDRAVTAAVTSATKVTGKVTSIRGIKVGDLVSASMTGTSGGRLTAAAIQDPASLPSGPGQ